MVEGEYEYEGGWSSEEEDTAADVELGNEDEMECTTGPYQILSSEAVSKRMMQWMEDLQDLFSLDIDQLMILARQYKWNQDNMSAWLSEEQDKLKYSLGLEFDQNLVADHPEMAASLPQNHGGYCPICYEEIDETNSAALSCQHTFCSGCWEDYLSTKIDSGKNGIDANCQ